MVKNIVKAGQDLVSHSKETETSRRGLAEELFPYIWVASKKMSTRAISRWLEENQGLQLSAVTISKIIKDPEEKMRNLTLEMLEKENEFFRSLPMTSFAGGRTTLFDEDAFESEAAIRNSPGAALIANDMGGYARLLGLYSSIKEAWFALPLEFREECRKFIAKPDLEKFAEKPEDFIVGKYEEQKGKDEK